jgi:hypothetical protein
MCSPSMSTWRSGRLGDDMTISIIEFLYSLAALRTHDEIVQPRNKIEPWLWAHYCFSDHVEGKDGFVAIFLATGETPYQPVSGADQ